VIATRALRRDMAGAAAFAAGVCLGDMIAILAIAFGLGVVLESRADLLAALRFAGVAYLLWLAGRIWAGSGGSEAEGLPAPNRAAAAAAGTALCLGNPSTFFFYLMLLPSAAPGGLSDFASVASVMLVSLAVVGMILGAVVLLAGRASRVAIVPSSSAAFGRAMALLLVGTAVWLALG